MKKLLFLLLALLPFTLQKFCFDCWSCPPYYLIACKPLKSGDYMLGYQCDCFLPDFPDLMGKEYVPKLTCNNGNLWAWCYLNDKINWKLDCACEYPS